MFGLTMTATALSLTMVSLKSEKLEHSQAVTDIMTSAVIDRISSLALVATLIPIARWKPYFEGRERLFGPAPPDG
jgi:Kef-type K+ transport system membrane component KefB